MKTTQVSLDLAFIGLFISLETVGGQTWTLTGAPITNWVALAASADGTRLVAAATSASYWAGYGPIFTSTNSGETWTQTSAPITNWNSLASSADGTVFAAADYHFGIWISTNSGLAWAPAAATPFAGNDAHVASSADGGKIVACAFGVSGNNYILTSTNSGVTWSTSRRFGYGYDLRVAASSADGITLFVAVGVGGFLSSTNSGATWVYNYTPFQTYVLACSAAGEKIAATAAGSFANWVSADSGATWTYTGLDGGWIACSADGIKLVAAKLGGIFTSTNFGATWTTNDAPGLDWYAVASSADGNKLFAVANNGGIYRLQTTPTPSLSIAPSGSDSIISWIVPSMPFVLQENADLTHTNWSDVTTPPILNPTNLHHEVSVPLASTNRFYRLKSL